MILVGVRVCLKNGVMSPDTVATYGRCPHPSKVDKSNQNVCDSQRPSVKHAFLNFICVLSQLLSDGRRELGLAYLINGAPKGLRG